MNKRSLTLFATSFILILASCSNHVESRFDQSLIRTSSYKDSLCLFVKSSDTLMINDYLIGDYTDFQIVEHGDQTDLIGINNRDHALDIIDLNAKESKGQIIFENDGPNGILGNIDGFFYHNSDSIFVFCIDENTIHLMNSDGKKIDKYTFNNSPLPDGFNDYDVYADQGIINGPYYNKKEKTLQFYTYRWLNPKEDDFNYHAFASYSIETREFQSIYGIYPKHFKKGVNLSLYNDPSLLVVDNLSYVYFGTSPNIYCYDNRTGALIYVQNYHSKHWPGTPESLPPRADYQEEQDWLSEKAAFVFLHHDPKNNIFYRMMKREQSIVGNNGLLKPRWYGKWSIEVFNSKMEPVGYYDLKENTFLPAISFTAKGNLWVKNPIKTENEEESLYYQISTKAYEIQ